MPSAPELYIGLMSGTSVDAIDAAIVEIGDNSTALLATHSHAIPEALQVDIAEISHPGDNEIERMGRLDRQLGSLFAAAALELLSNERIASERISAIGSHGQTVRHAPPSSRVLADDSFTLQIGDPNTITELTGITTVADFRRRDIAAGGEGAPLAPAFHAAALSRAGSNRCIVNIGGIANTTILQGTNLVAGFDTGPGNTLLDHWHALHCVGPFDDRGVWGASGTVQQDLLKLMLGDAYFEQSGPRSTGKELFNLPWLQQRLEEAGELAPADVQATLVEFTATSICRPILSCNIRIEEVYVCGGGVHNDYLMARLAEHLAPAKVASTSAAGIDPDWVEAMTFAWLARQTLNHAPGNAPQVTGAKNTRILGAVYPA